MQITIKSKQMDVSPRMRAHIEQKLQRLGRLVGDEARMDVTVVDEKTRSAKDRYAVHLELTNVRHLNPRRATASGTRPLATAGSNCSTPRARPTLPAPTTTARRRSRPRA